MSLLFLCHVIDKQLAQKLEDSVMLCNKPHKMDGSQVFFFSFFFVGNVAVLLPMSCPDYLAQAFFEIIHVFFLTCNANKPYEMTSFKKCMYFCFKRAIL